MDKMSSCVTEKSTFLAGTTDSLLLFFRYQIRILCGKCNTFSPSVHQLHTELSSSKKSTMSGPPSVDSLVQI